LRLLAQTAARRGRPVFGILHNVRSAVPVAVLSLAAIALVSRGERQAPGSPAAPSTAAQQTPSTSIQPTPAASPPVRNVLNTIVLDPAHGGTDPGARGVGGIRESDLVLTLAAQIRAALEKQGFSVVQTRQGNDNPSLDDRSAMANAQRGAIFVSLHFGSTGLPGTVRVYTLPDAPVAPLAAGALIPWDRAQATFLPMSRKLAELAQAELTLHFKGSPNTAPSASVRQLRTIALPAIAIELSSVSVEERETLDKMLPGVAEAVARAVAAYKAVYDAAPIPGALP
jgi:N-acetylmuramoyl-L-alanine amidase